jgi:hypothetical protein
LTTIVQPAAIAGGRVVAGRQDEEPIGGRRQDGVARPVGEAQEGLRHRRNDGQALPGRPSNDLCAVSDAFDQDGSRRTRDRGVR